jgi:hypothetical protein
MTGTENMRSTLATAARDAGCSDADFSLVSLHEYQRVLDQIVDRFCGARRGVLNATWLWQHLVGPKETIQTARALEYLEALLPLDDRVWFIAEDWYCTKKHGNYWLYETTVSAAIRVLREAHAFEYYLVKRDLSWLVCETHHDVVIGTGQEVVRSMQRARASR